MNVEQAKKILVEIKKNILKEENYLSELDGIIGDGDHGHNMAKGMTCVVDKIENINYDDFQSLFKDVSMQLISNVGGASGPLYGTAFMEMAKICKDKKELTKNDLLPLLDAAIKGIQKRGKASVNEKTMLDVLIPTKEYIDKVGIDNFVSENDNICNYIKECCEKTKDIQATKGRASYLQERSIGHIDPGATSMSIFLLALMKGIKND